MSDMQMTTIAPGVENETAGPVCEATMVQQPSVIVMGGQQFKKDPPCYRKCLCPCHTVFFHEGCGGSCIAACFLGSCYTMLCWTPQQIPL
tara:strand:+ start:337 stop:606 length:270 start_codon:yes stop_codon:yes gene_type:complete